MTTIGWYAHHHGAGHRTRARVVGAELLARGAEVTVLGSGLDEPTLRTAGLGCVELPLDHPLAPGVALEDVDAEVGGLLHWAPRGHPGLRARMARIAAWLEAERPAVLVVDVSTEVALLARLLGIPVVLVAQPGDRRDEAHTTALRCATAVLAPWPAWATPAIWRTAIAVPQPDLVAVGGVAQEAVGASDAPRAGAGRRTGLVLAGGEGFDDPGVPEQVRAAVPDLDWVVLDGRTWVPDVRALIADSAVVVAHAGQNAVADIARHARPAVLTPQQRPFAEQQHLAAALGRQGLAVLAGPTQVREHGWAALVARARAEGGRGWGRWECAGAAGRAGDLIERVAHG
ncbi:glycosyltransferase [Ornithinimicrobium sp. LYQ92]|uniref:glycosyltransferase n=1 Tax=Serinicoccus sp. LYQ92 TaxID=3378798 RepID=UPI0038555C6C